jgi:hypothetical protein
MPLLQPSSAHAAPLFVHQTLFVHHPAAFCQLAEEYLRLLLECLNLMLVGPPPGEDSDRSVSVAAINSAGEQRG